MPRDIWPVQNPRVAWRVYDGEAVIASPDDSTLHTLNAAGTLVWESADGVTPVDRIVERLCREFDLPRDAGARDVAAFVEMLRERGLLTAEAVARDQPTIDASLRVRSDDDRPAGPRAYEPPVILSEQMFETTALACGKIGGSGGACNVRPKSS